MADVAQAEGHPNESEVDAVLSMADYAISGSLTVAEGAEEAFRLLADDLGAS